MRERAVCFIGVAVDVLTMATLERFVCDAAFLMLALLISTLSSSYRGLHSVVAGQ